jgi:hypothetical protein
MSIYLLIAAIEILILLAVWRWDERARRAELHERRRLRLMQTGSPQNESAATHHPSPSSSVPTAAA